MPGLHPRNFEEYLRKLERDIAASRRGPIAIVNGAIEVIRVEQEAKDSRTPTAPIELTYQTAVYNSAQTWGREGGARVRFILDFPDVTKATDGTDIAVDRYELWGREVTPGGLSITTSAVPGVAAPGLTIPGLAATFEQKQAEAAALAGKKLNLIQSSPTSSFRADGFIPGTVWEFRARAIGVNNIKPGNPSAVITVQMLDDTTPPPQPTAPVVTSSRGQLVVTHDGQAVTGAMPADLSYMILAHGGNAQPTQEVARFGRAGIRHIQTDVEYLDPRFFRVRAVDESGNEGPWSEVGMGYAEALVDTDIILSEIDAAKTHLKNVDAGVSILPDTIITEHLHVTESMSAAMGQFLHLKAGQIDVNDLWADNAFFGLADALIVRSDMFMGKTFEGGQFTLTHGGKFQTDPEDLKGIKWTSNGIYAWNSTSGENTFVLDALTGSMLATGTFYTDLTGSRVRIGDRDNISAVDLWSDTTIAHGALFHFYNSTLDSYGTQVTQFGLTSETVPESFMQLRDDGITIAHGTYGTAQRYMEVYDDEARIVHNYGSMQIKSGSVLLAHSKAGMLSSPYVDLDGDVRQVRITTGTLSGDTSDYGQILLKHDNLTMRVNSGWFIDLTPSYFTVDLGTSANIYLDPDDYLLRVKGDVTYQSVSNTGNWGIGPRVDVETLGRGAIAGAVDTISIYSNGAAGGNGTANWLSINKTAIGQLTGGLNLYGGLNVYNGTKNFVMPHPTKIGMELAHAATESPWSGIHYWGAGTLNKDGYWIVQLPDYFEHIAAQDQRLVIVTSPSGAKLTWDHEIVNGEFMVEGKPGAPFGWEVLARREGYDVEVERWVDGIRNTGEPYEPAEERQARQAGYQKPKEKRAARPTMDTPPLPEKPKMRDGTPDSERKPARRNRDTRDEAGEGSDTIRDIRSRNAADGGRDRVRRPRT